MKLSCKDNQIFLFKLIINKKIYKNFSTLFIRFLQSLFLGMLNGFAPLLLTGSGLAKVAIFSTTLPTSTNVNKKHCLTN